MSASAYYQRPKGQRSVRAIKDERLLGRIRELHAANFDRYGSRRTWKALRRAGEQALDHRHRDRFLQPRGRRPSPDHRIACRR